MSNLHKQLEKICLNHSFSFGIGKDNKFRVLIPWTNIKDNTQGLEPVEVSSVKELYQVLGY